MNVRLDRAAMKAARALLTPGLLVAVGLGAACASGEGGWLR